MASYAKLTFDLFMIRKSNSIGTRIGSRICKYEFQATSSWTFFAAEYIVPMLQFSNRFWDQGLN